MKNFTIQRRGNIHSEEVKRAKASTSYSHESFNSDYRSTILFSLAEDLREIEPQNDFRMDLAFILETLAVELALNSYGGSKNTNQIAVINQEEKVDELFSGEKL